MAVHCWPCDPISASNQSKLGVALGTVERRLLSALQVQTTKAEVVFADVDRTQVDDLLSAQITDIVHLGVGLLLDRHVDGWSGSGSWSGLV